MYFYRVSRAATMPYLTDDDVERVLTYEICTSAPLGVYDHGGGAGRRRPHTLGRERRARERHRRSALRAGGQRLGR